MHTLRSEILRRFLSLLLVVLLASTCAGEGKIAQPTSAQAPPPLWHPKQPRPEDRDAKVVEAALAGLDVCSLLDMGVYERRKAEGAGPVNRRLNNRGGRRGCKLDHGGLPLFTVFEDPRVTAAMWWFR